MPMFAILGIKKQKGGAVAVSSHHNDRTREVPNADPARTHLNRVLAGDERNVREIVTEFIRERGGKPRKDAVEAVELLCKASPQFFAETDPAKLQEKIDRFCELAMQFLQDENSGGVLVKAVLHMDEHTPHIHAHKVPYDPEGHLNAKHYFDGRKKMEAKHDLYAEYMKPLGLERGRRRSRATHERIEEFYRSIDQPVRLEVDHDEIPDPPKMLLTEEARKQYKEKVVRAVLKGLEEPHKVMRDQSMLARHERGQREEAERKAAERVAEAEREAQEKIAAYQREAQWQFDNQWRSARLILEEKGDLERENKELRDKRDELEKEVARQRQEKFEYSRQARQYSDRLTDIPMEDVMERLGYEGERRGEATVYRGGQNRVAVIIQGQKAYDGQGEPVCKNSLDLVVHMRRQHEGVEGYTQDRALEWLREKFDEKPARGAYLVNREHFVLETFERRREERERVRAQVAELSRDPLGAVRGRGEANDRGWRGGHDKREGGPSRGGGR
jgi:Plasmid recombination enzyme